jgi:hypothetical protein
MAQISSEYGFPIFISSTEYNLVDLRAELAKYLSDLGYKPILSSSEGFHDNSPELEPWESCLQVLQSTYIMVLVIDGKYGQKLDWKNFKEIIGHEKVSPTHAEYLFAHKTNMRMLVFIRKELLTYYQIYRAALKNSKGDKDLAKNSLLALLPSHIEFDTLNFIQEIKTSGPIPWIKSFENVTEIKLEVQKKLLNELAELFLFKNKHLEAVVRAFSTAIDGLTDEKRREILERIGATKELIILIESQTIQILELKKEKEKIEKELKDKIEISHNTKKKDSIEALKSVEDLSKQLENLNIKISGHEINNANFILSGSNNPSLALSSLATSPSVNDILLGGMYSKNGHLVNLNNPNISTILGSSVSNLSANTCEKCKNIIIPANISIINPLSTCTRCKKKLCKSCFSGKDTAASLAFVGICQDCRNQTSFGK